MTGAFRFDRAKRPERMKDNVLRETAEGTKLECGHYTQGQPVVIYPGHWKRYDCPEGCGLQKGKR